MTVRLWAESNSRFQIQLFQRFASSMSLLFFAGLKNCAFSFCHGVFMALTILFVVPLDIQQVAVLCVFFLHKIMVETVF